MKPLDPVDCPHCESMNVSYSGEEREEKREVFYCNSCHSVIYIDWPKGYEPKWRHL